jgi:hypothetical protein
MGRRAALRLGYGAIMLAIATAIVLLVAFQPRPSSPAGSARQQYRGQSIFTAAGRAFSARIGFVTISLAADRPAAAKLGLPASGDTTAAYRVPLTIDVSSRGDSIRLQLVQGVDILTREGKIAEVLFSTEHPYDEQYESASNLITTGGTSTDLAAFDAALHQDRAESNHDRYHAVEHFDARGMSTRVELSGTQRLAQLAIRVTPASRTPEAARDHR